MSQCHISQTRVLQGAELSWYQTTSIPVAHTVPGTLGPARAAAAGRGACALPTSSLDIGLPLLLPPWAGIGWSFPSNVAGKWEKVVGCPGYRPDRTQLSADSSSYPKAQVVDFCLTEGKTGELCLAEAKPCQGDTIWKASAVVCNILSFYLFPPLQKRRKVHTKTMFKANCKAKH